MYFILIFFWIFFINNEKTCYGGGELYRKNMQIQIYFTTLITTISGLAVVRMGGPQVP